MTVDELFTMVYSAIEKFDYEEKIPTSEKEILMNPRMHEFLRAYNDAMVSCTKGNDGRPAFDTIFGVKVVDSNEMPDDLVVVRERPKFFALDGGGNYVPVERAENLNLLEHVNPFGEPYLLGIDLASNAFAQTELAAYFTATEFRKLLKVFGIKRKILADRRRMESARRYRERKAVKREKKLTKRMAARRANETLR